MAYVALYRQWRPQNFDALVGQQPVKTALTNALNSKKIAHAYLFSGPRGTGKTSTARILAKALNCEHGPTASPCGHCSNCERIANGTSMDVFEIDAASNRGIDEIKALRDQLAFTPVDSRYKVYIIDEVHMLTTEAFNALLKTLEEPPAHVIFILATTDPHKIPATIHSRCQRFDFRRVTLDEITHHLAYVAQKSNIEADMDALRLIAIQAEGGMRDALSLLDQCGVMAKKITVDTVRQVLGIVGREALHSLTLSIGRQDLTEALRQLNRLLEQGKDVKQILAELAEYCRAVLLYKSAPSFDEIYLTDTAEALKSCAELFSDERLLAAEERIHTATMELRGGIRPRITAELCLIDLCRIEGNTLAELCARIDALERKLQLGLPVIKNDSVKKDKIVKQNVVEEKEFSPIEPQQPVTVKKKAIADFGVEVIENKALKEDNVKSLSNTLENSNEEYAGDIATGEDYWCQTLELLQNEKQFSVVSCAKHGRVYSFVNGVLQIAFKAEFLGNRLNNEDYRKICEDALLRISRQPIKLQAAGEKQLNSKKSKISVNKKLVDTTSAKQDNESKLDTEQLPEKLRKAMQVFGGTIKEV